MLYEMAAGRRPFDHATDAETIAAILRDAPPPLTDVPQPLLWLIERCLAKNPAERYGSTRELARELASLRGELESGAPAVLGPAARRRRPRRGPRSSDERPSCDAPGPAPPAGRAPADADRPRRHRARRGWRCSWPRTCARTSGTGSASRRWPPPRTRPGWSPRSRRPSAWTRPPGVEGARALARGAEPAAPGRAAAPAGQRRARHRGGAGAGDAARAARPG